jgi:hypothetical protein
MLPASSWLTTLLAAALAAALVAVPAPYGAVLAVHES